MLGVRRLIIALAALAPLLTATQAAADWPTYHGNNTRQGDDTTDQAVSGTAPWTSTPLDGQLYGQPVIVGGRLIAATENDTVYSLNAATGQVEWTTHIGIGPPRTANFPCGDIDPLGITGTPVIDAGNVFVVAEKQDTPTRFEFDLVTLSLSTGAITRDVNIDPGNRGGINFDANYQQQRGALTIAGGEVYATLGGLAGDCTNPSNSTDGYRGYVIAYPETGTGTVQWWSSASLTSTDMEAGAWAAGGASVDSSGNVFVATGNSNETSSGDAYDESDGVIKLTAPSLSLADYFAPSGVVDANHDGGPTWWQDNASDADLGSSTPLQLPGNRVFQVGKSGMGYLLNSAGLGHVSGGLASHRVCSAFSDAAFGSLAYSLVGGVETVFVGCSDGLQAVRIAPSNTNFSLAWHNTGQASDKPPIVVGGGVWSVSSGGGTLNQYDASDGSLLARYAISGSNHFTSPSASNGMIYVEGGNQVDAVPDGPDISTVSPAAGPTAGGQTVTVHGAGFQSGVTMTATIGGVSVTPTAVTSTSFTFTTPAGTAGYVQVQVADTLGTSALTPGSGYFYTGLAAYVPVTPFRLLDTRAANCIQCGTGALGPGVTRTLQVTGVGGLPSGADPIPSTATAVALNVTAVNDNTFSLLTVYPNGTGRPLASNINFLAHTATANLVTVTLGQNGLSDANREVNIYNPLGTVDVVADVEGYFEPDTASDPAGEFHPIAPVRVCDTRKNVTPTRCQAHGALQSAQPLIVNVAGSGGDAIPATNAAVAVLNLAGIAGTASTYLSVFPTTSSGTCAYTGSHAPPFSTLNLAAGAVVANRVMVALGPAATGGPDTSICIFNAVGSINIYVDANGWFGSAAAATGYQYQAVGPTRVCDTRAASGVRCSGSGLGPAASQLVRVAGVYGIPSGSPVVQAVIGNLTGVAPSQGTYLALYPANLNRPLASDINIAAGAVLANLVVVQLDTTDSAIGDVRLYNGAGNVNAILDIEGWFQ
ncbi:MAG TPA: IPT/TIG domain-containing protein [Candidatus Saccharimonadales bacterium]|nr:IPT/TIG domain-containing protein [Candidatus Saccharimonadales bacterium]